ncbi:ABC transporter ATP-binding protein [Tropicimonas sp. IMCC34011]|uniref:ABC transporter ATP-binding protein n=1 Tax=Tropicimonas sp. IMCC34011 TaxID=2248759 RepID=UPI000E24EFF4|nr:ABC transporter transmembrane domain-containing protein [Tropicimonas sp. IMCC34011]
MSKLDDRPDLSFKDQRRLFAWAWTTYVRRFLWVIIIAGILMSVEGSMLGLLSYMMKPMFDNVFISGNYDALYWVAGVIFGIFVVRAAMNLGQRIIITRASNQIVFNVQHDLLRHLMMLDTLFHSANPPGALMERMKGDTGSIKSVANVVITGVGRDIVSLISLLTVVMVIDWKWTLIALVGTPFLVLPSLLIQKLVRTVTRENRQIASDMSTRLNEVFHGIAPVKLNELETYQSDRYRALADRRINSEVRASIAKALIPAMIDLMSGLGFCAVLLFGGSEIINGDKTVGEFMSFFAAMALAFDPIRRLGAVSGTFQATAVSMDRIKAVFDTQPNLVMTKSPKKMPEALGDIELRDVELAYGDLPVLRKASFVARSGETTALVGASGAGKSTVFNVLTRLVETDGGEVTLGGANIRDLDLADLRSQFSMVSQDALLFDESLRENILLGRTDVSEERLREVMEAAHITDFVDNLADGLDSPAGPRGGNLSGGQRQRVAIARALLRDRPILLLDEATSALDMRSEAVVQAALDRLAEGRTTIVIAHRLSTIRNADRIVVMDGGRVVEEGTHDELLVQDGRYAELYRLQFRNSESSGDAEDGDEETGAA